MPLSHVEFGKLLKIRRKNARFSQLNLALEADISQRHISFLEQGRAKPSQVMVVKIAKVLKLDYQNINQMLIAAGFAPIYQSSLDKSAKQKLGEYTNFMLNQHMPYPALVVDENWNIQTANENAIKLFCWLLDASPELLFADNDRQANLLDLILGNAMLIEHIENWPQVAHFMVRRALDEAMVTQMDINKMVDDLPLQWQAGYNTYGGAIVQDAILPVIYKKGDVRISLISLQSKFMMSQNIAVDQLSLEYFIPNDAATKLFFENF